MSKKVTIDIDDFNAMSTVAIQSAIDAKTALSMVKEAKMGTWYDDNWTPYCLADGCSRMPRMVRKEYGFQCGDCKNMIGHDCRRLQESPLNYK